MPRLPAALLIALAAGCGGGSVAMPDYGSEDGLKLAQLVSSFEDAKGDPAKFKKFFADAPPPNRKDYEKFVYEVAAGSPKVTGDAATAMVNVRLDSDNSVVATAEWTFSKVGDSWKIKAAPLK